MSSSSEQDFKKSSLVRIFLTIENDQMNLIVCFCVNAQLFVSCGGVWWRNRGTIYVEDCWRILLDHREKIWEKINYGLRQKMTFCEKKMKLKCPIIERKKFEVFKEGSAPVMKRDANKSGRR